MNAEIITVGTGMMRGGPSGDNTAFLSEQLAACGMVTNYQTAVGNGRSHIAHALQAAAERSDVIILTGESADGTLKQTVCEALGLEPDRLPDGATVFESDGGAQGFAVSAGDQHIIVLSGDANELRRMTADSVVPFLLGISGSAIVSHTVKIFGMTEHEVRSRLGNAIGGTNPTVDIYTGQGEVRLTITASAATTQAAENLCAPAVKFLSAKLGDSVYGIDSGSLEEVVVSHLKKRGLTVATAESCTAGLLSKRITDVSGSSAVFPAGIAAYSNDIKVKLLDIPEQVIRTHGAVSAEVAKRMALGARNVGGTDLGIGITGVAGASVEGKPSGLVYIAMTDGDRMWLHKLDGDGRESRRDYVREMAAGTALDMLRRYLFALPDVLEGAEDILKTRLTFNPNAAGKTAEAEAEDGDFNLQITDSMIDSAFAGGAASAEDDAVEDDSDEFIIPEEAQPVEKTPAEPDEFVFGQIIRADADEFSIDEISAAQGDGDEFAAMWQDTDKDGNGAPAKESRPFFARMAHAVIPWKGDTVSEIVRKVILLACVAVLIVSCCYIGGSINDRLVYEHEITYVRDLYDNTDQSVDESGFMNKFKRLYESNPEVVGWLTVPGTKTDNPVYQTDNNDYYLKHNGSKENSVYGALFADYRCSVNPSERSQNVTVYGHHMRDGSMLAEITKYKSISFYKENPIITFDTIYGNGKYKVFAAFITNDEADGDNGYRFNFEASSFASQSDFLTWVEQVRRRSVINTTVDVAEDDKILTLSTCTYDIKGVELRFVVMARLLRDGESESVNLTGASQNAKPLYPACWYEAKGGSKPTFSDGTYTWFPEGTDQSIIDNVISQQQSASSNASSSVSSQTSSGGSSHSVLSGLSSLPSKISSTNNSSNSAPSSSAADSSAGDSSNTATSSNTSSDTSTSSNDSSDPPQEASDTSEQ